MKKIILSFILPFITWGAGAQVGIKSLEGYFRNPLDGVLIPSANYAETRPNHFHSGIDIKTGGVEGKQLYAAADGYISRIGIVPGGFGRVLYINHPNGTTSVYAHMQRFTAAIEKYVTAERYRQKKHNVDIYLDTQTFPVKKGDPIGLSGNSGRSGGPHLHYEIRDAATQDPINPITRGAVIMKDNIPPTIVRLHYIEVDTINGVPLNSKPRTIGVTKISPTRYTLKDTLTVGPRGYFVLEATDRKNDTQNTMGIYSVNVLMDGEPLFGFALDRYSFTDTRYVNSLSHYAMQKGSRNEMLRLALQENNRLPVFSKMKNRGLVQIDDSDRHTIMIEVADDSGNVTTLDFSVRKRETDRRFYSQSDAEGTKLDCLKPFTITADGLTVTIPERALYESVFFTHGIESPPALKNASVPRFSPVYRIYNASVPLHKAITISIESPELPARLREKACLGIISTDGTNISSAGGVYENGRVTGNSSVFGRFCVVADTVPPTIAPNFANGQDLRAKKTITFTIKDNFSGIDSFVATIDGQWIIFEQNVMNNTVTHHFDPSKIAYNGGKHNLVITVTDNKGNISTVKRDFIK